MASNKVDRPLGALGQLALLGTEAGRARLLERLLREAISIIEVEVEKKHDKEAVASIHAIADQLPEPVPALSYRLAALKRALVPRKPGPKPKRKPIKPGLKGRPPKWKRVWIPELAAAFAEQIEYERLSLGKGATYVKAIENVLRRNCPRMSAHARTARAKQHARRLKDYRKRALDT